MELKCAVVVLAGYHHSVDNAVLSPQLKLGFLCPRQNHLTVLEKKKPKPTVDC